MSLKKIFHSIKRKTGGLIEKILYSRLGCMLPDDNLIKIKYYMKFREKLNLDNPVTFNEKLQWLKLFDRKDYYTRMVDKFEAKKYVEDIIGKKYIIPTIGVYDSFDEIDFDKLPDRFVMKCTHDSGGLIICRDKAELDIRAARRKINKCLKRNFYYYSREWPYKNVKPRIIIEKYMSNNGEELQDYKIHCFNGVPKIILLCRDRYKKTGLTENFYDTDWHLLNIRRPNHGLSRDRINKPKELKQMLDLARILSKDIPFLRTDFYIIDGKIFFGELTFFPASGFERFEPPEVDAELGSWLKIGLEK